MCNALLQTGIVFVGIMLLSGCQHPTDAALSPTDGVRQTVPTAHWAVDRHWIHDEKLRDLMSSLVTRTAWPERDFADGKNQNQRRRRAFQEAALLAGDLAEAGRRLPDMIARRKLSPADRRVFTSQAAKLRDLSEQLRRRAVQRDAHGMKLMLEAIDRTCTACHSRFRDLSDLLGPREARAHDRPTVSPGFGRRDEG